MVVLDTTIVYTALPTIDAALGFGPGEVQWVLTAYAVVVGGMLLLWGRVADLVGRRRMFMISTGLFAVTSLICGLSWASEVLIVTRGFQGLAGAMLTPAGLSILMTIFPAGAERNKALGIWGSLASVAATTGLVAGGPITLWLGWEWIFFINVPVGIGALLLSRPLLPESRDQAYAGRFDLAGAVTITAGLLVLSYAVLRAPENGWGSVWTVGGFAVSAALFALFVVAEARSAAPLVPLRVFRSRLLVGGNLVLLAAGIAIDGLLITFTLYSQNVLGYSALQFGLAMSVMTVVGVVGLSAGQRLVTAVGARAVAVAGMVHIGVACLLFSRVTTDTRFVGIILVGMVVFGVGLGSAFVSGQIAALSDVDADDAGLASGVAESSFSIGNALGVAAISAVALSRADQLIGRGMAPLLSHTEGYRLAFTVVAVIAALGAVAALTMLTRTPGRAATTAEASPR